MTRQRMMGSWTRAALLLAAFAAFAVSEAVAQFQAGPQAGSRNWTAVTYGSAIGTEDTGQIVDATSWRNVGLEWRFLTGTRASIGFFGGWNVFHDDVAGELSLGGVDVSGFQQRYVNALPLLVTGHYYLTGPGPTTAFLGTGIGTYWVESRLDIGITSLEESAWHFGLAPEVGLAFPMGSGTVDGFFSVKYNYAFEADDVTHAYWTFSIGVAGGY